MTSECSLEALCVACPPCALGRLPARAAFRCTRNNNPSLGGTARSHNRLAAPLLLCWGERDPWVVSAIGDRYEAAATALGRDVTRVSIDGGHCPHDENPAQVNAALLDWMGGLA